MDLHYNNTSTGVSDTLYHAQLIANTFAKTLEDNNCVLMLTVGLDRNIDESIKDLEDMVESVNETNNALDGNVSNSYDGSYTSDNILEQLNSLVDDLKDKCFVCDLKFPGLDFNHSLSTILGDLEHYLNLYNSTFKIDKLDLCQATYSMQKSCVPDILKLIALLITAFVAIMTLKKLSNISITAFIKGVLSVLLGKIMSALKLTVTIGSTNIACLLNTLKEIALALPTQENIAAQLSEQEKKALGLIDDEGNETGSNVLRNETVDSLYGTLKGAVNNANGIDSSLDDIELELNEAFTLINGVVDTSLEKVNDYIGSLLNFQTFFECETKRSGIDVEDALGMINKLIQVLNALSSLVISMVKKEMRLNACKASNTINDTSEEEIDDLFIKDIISNNNDTIVEIIDSSDSTLEVIITEKPLNNSLPKLDLLNCSIQDFVDAHRLPNILNVAKKQLDDEDRRTIITDGSNYTFKRPSGNTTELIDNIVDLIYTKPEQTEKEEISEIEIDLKNPIGLKGISPILSETLREKPNATLACKSVEDVLNILSTIKR